MTDWKMPQAALRMAQAVPNSAAICAGRSWRPSSTNKTLQQEYEQMMELRRRGVRRQPSSDYNSPAAIDRCRSFGCHVDCVFQPATRSSSESAESTGAASGEVVSCIFARMSELMEGAAARALDEMPSGSPGAPDVFAAELAVQARMQQASRVSVRRKVALLEQQQQQEGQAVGQRGRAGVEGEDGRPVEESPTAPERLQGEDGGCESIQGGRWAHEGKSRSLTSENCKARAEGRASVVIHEGSRRSRKVGSSSLKTLVEHEASTDLREAAEALLTADRLAFGPKPGAPGGLVGSTESNRHPRGSCRAALSDGSARPQVRSPRTFPAMPSAAPPARRNQRELLTLWGPSTAPCAAPTAAPAGSSSKRELLLEAGPRTEPPASAHGATVASPAKAPRVANNECKGSRPLVTGGSQTAVHLSLPGKLVAALARANRRSSPSEPWIRHGPLGNRTSCSTRPPNPKASPRLLSSTAAVNIAAGAQVQAREQIKHRVRTSPTALGAESLIPASEQAPSPDSIAVRLRAGSTPNLVSSVSRFESVHGRSASTCPRSQAWESSSAMTSTIDSLDPFSEGPCPYHKVPVSPTRSRRSRRIHLPDESSDAASSHPLRTLKPSCTQTLDMTQDSLQSLRDPEISFSGADSPRLCSAAKAALPVITGESNLGSTHAASDLMVESLNESSLHRTNNSSAQPPAAPPSASPPPRPQRRAEARNHSATQKKSQPSRSGIPHITACNFCRHVSGNLFRPRHNTVSPSHHILGLPL
jgi:hypothetical protein